MAQLQDDPFDERADRSRRISQVTRRDIFDYLRTEGGPWWGRLTEVAFLGRLYDLETLPSTDRRFATAGRDIVQHRVGNNDWDDDWVFDDPRFELAGGPDENSWVSLPRWSIRSFSPTQTERPRSFPV